MEKWKRTLGIDVIIGVLFVMLLTEMTFFYKTHKDFDRINRAFLVSLSDTTAYAQQQPSEKLPAPPPVQKNTGEKQRLEDIFSSSSLLSLRRIAIPRMIEQYKQTYQYRIQAVHEGEANVSQEGDSVNLVWKKFSSAEAPDKIIIYRSSSASVLGESIAEVNGTKDGYQDVTVEKGKAYFYSLVAEKGAYKSLPVKIPVSTINDTIPPDPPRNVQTAVDYDEGGIKVTWENPKKADFFYTNIYRSEAAGELGTIIAKKIVASEYLDRTVKLGTDYYYTLVSVDGSGNESLTQTILTVGNLGNPNPFQQVFPKP